MEGCYRQAWQRRRQKRYRWSSPRYRRLSLPPWTPVNRHTYAGHTQGFSFWGGSIHQGKLCFIPLIYTVKMHLWASERQRLNNDSFFVFYFLSVSMIKSEHLVMKYDNRIFIFRRTIALHFKHRQAMNITMYKGCRRLGVSYQQEKCNEMKET